MKKVLFLLSMIALGSLYGAAYQSAETDSIQVENNTPAKMLVSLFFANDMPPYIKMVEGNSESTLTFPKDRNLVGVEVTNLENRVKQKLANTDINWISKKSNSDLTLVISKGDVGWSVSPEWISVWGGQAEFAEDDLDEVLARLGIDVTKSSETPEYYEGAYTVFKDLFKQTKRKVQCSFEQRAALTAKYKELTKSYHPDKGGTKEQFQALQNAYNEVLSKLPQRIGGGPSSQSSKFFEEYNADLQTFRTILKNAYKDVPADERREAFYKKYDELYVVYGRPNEPAARAFALEAAFQAVNLDLLQNGI